MQQNIQTEKKWENTPSTKTSIKIGSPPDFVNDGIAIWVNKKKDGEDYLSIQILGKNGIKVNCFKYNPQQKRD